MRPPLNTVHAAIVAAYSRGVSRTRWLRALWRLALKDRRMRLRGGDQRDHDLILRLIAGEMSRDVRLRGRSVRRSPDFVNAPSRVQ